MLLLGASDPPASGSQVAGNADMNQLSQAPVLILMVQSTYIHFIMNLNLSQEQGANIK
jgi:hypothetical protein